MKTLLPLLAFTKAGNSHEKVYSTMKRWLKMNSKSKTIYNELLAAIPAASDQLAEHYTRTFGLSRDDAQRLAETGLDAVLRNSFPFGSQ